MRKVLITGGTGFLGSHLIKGIIDDIDIATEKENKQKGTKEIGESCIENEECVNDNCEKHFKGNYCSLKTGDYFPKFKAVNQHGEMIDIYDFSNHSCSFSYVIYIIY